MDRVHEVRLPKHLSPLSCTVVQCVSMLPLFWCSFQWLSDLSFSLFSGSLRVTSSYMVCWFGLNGCTYRDCKRATKRRRNHTCENISTAHIHVTAPESQNTSFSVFCSTRIGNRYSVKPLRNIVFILSRQNKPKCSGQYFPKIVWLSIFDKKLTKCVFIAQPCRAG